MLITQHSLKNVSVVKNSFLLVAFNFYNRSIRSTIQLSTHNNKLVFTVKSKFFFCLFEKQIQYMWL